ncbi:MAG TPA: hypothetical protein VHO66_02330 [Ruminiclostridium sp.]|nr:hypothetical protein [Ruminiclostridium sp.]
MKISSIHRVAFIALIVALSSHAAVVRCIITDSKTGSPVDSVKAVFSFNYQPQLPVYTDSAGILFTQALFDGVTHVQLFLSKDGYDGKTMSFGNNMTVTDTFTISTTLVQSSTAVVKWTPGPRWVAMGNGAGASFTLNGRRACATKRVFASQVFISAGLRVNLLASPCGVTKKDKRQVEPN